MAEVVNVVGSGFLRREFDLSVVAEDFDSLAEFDPRKLPGNIYQILRRFPTCNGLSDWEVHYHWCGFY
jgi:TATA-box binding protein (TBP) (component of TFIID and TFIIIB)